MREVDEDQPARHDRVGDRPRDQPVQVVQAIAEDGDARRQRHQPEPGEHQDPRRIERPGEADDEAGEHQQPAYPNHRSCWRSTAPACRNRQITDASARTIATHRQANDTIWMRPFLSAGSVDADRILDPPDIGPGVTAIEIVNSDGGHDAEPRHRAPSRRWQSAVGKQEGDEDADDPDDRAEGHVREHGDRHGRGQAAAAGDGAVRGVCGSGRRPPEHGAAAPEQPAHPVVRQVGDHHGTDHAERHHDLADDQGDDQIGRVRDLADGDRDDGRRGHQPDDDSAPARHADLRPGRSSRRSRPVPVRRRHEAERGAVGGGDQAAGRGHRTG